MNLGGRIVNIGSSLGDRVPFSGVAHYSGTKAAVVGLSEGWPRDLGSKGITIDVVQPGPILLAAALAIERLPRDPTRAIVRRRLAILERAQVRPPAGETVVDSRQRLAGVDRF